ncbi:MAG: hypothetical protein ACK5NA_04905 [Enterococcus sp.]
MKKNKLLRKLPQAILAFICSLLLFAILALGCLKLTLFNQNFMIRQTHEVQYAQLVTKEINTTIQDYGMGSNIPAKVLKNVVSKKLVQENVDSYIRGIYTDVPFQLTGEDQVKNQIQTVSEAYAKEKGYTMDAETQKNLDTLKETGVTTLDKYVELPYLLTFGQQIMQFNKTLTLMIGVIGAVFLLVFFGMMYVSGRWWHRKVRYMAYIMGGAGLMLSVLPAIIYFKGTVNRIAITSKAMYEFMTTYLNAFTLTFVWVGVVGILLAVILWGVSEALRRRVARSGS